MFTITRVFREFVNKNNELTNTGIVKKAVGETGAFEVCIKGNFVLILCIHKGIKLFQILVEYLAILYFVQFYR